MTPRRQEHASPWRPWPSSRTGSGTGPSRRRRPGRGDCRSGTARASENHARVRALPCPRPPAPGRRGMSLSDRSVRTPRREHTQRGGRRDAGQPSPDEPTNTAATNVTETKADRTCTPRHGQQCRTVIARRLRVRIPRDGPLAWRVRDRRMPNTGGRRGKLGAHQSWTRRRGPVRSYGSPRARRRSATCSGRWSSNHAHRSALRKLPLRRAHPSTRSNTTSDPEYRSRASMGPAPRCASAASSGAPSASATSHRPARALPFRRAECPLGSADRVST